MKNKIKLVMEVDGMLMVVVAEYCYYGPESIQMETIMDRDGEPVEPIRPERDRLFRRINAKHRAHKEVA